MEDLLKARTAFIAISLIFGALVVACSPSEKRSGFDETTASTEPEGGASFGAGERSHNCSAQSDPDADEDNDGYPVKFDCDD